MGRSPCCSKEGINRGAWTASEDKILTDYIKLHGDGKWRNIPKEAGLKRCGKSCRLRWMNYLRPDIKRGNISSDEEDLIFRLHKLLGNRWSLIAGRLPGRTDNEIKNYWNTHLSKRGQDKKLKRKPKPPSMDANLVQNVAAESESSDGSLTTLTSRNEKSCLEFMVDMNAGGETSVSEIFASDFTKLSHDLGASDMYNAMLGDDYMNTIAQSQASVPPEEMEQNWGGSDFNIQANLDLDFGCLVDFLESAEEWII